MAAELCEKVVGKNISAANSGKRDSQLREHQAVALSSRKEFSTASVERIFRTIAAGLCGRRWRKRCYMPYNTDGQNTNLTGPTPAC